MMNYNRFTDHYDELFLKTKELKKLGDSNSQLDVLHIIAGIDRAWPLPSWFAEKSTRWVSFLRKLGYQAKAYVPQFIFPNADRDIHIEIIQRIKPRILISRAFALRGRDLGRMAMVLPDTFFIQSNHTPNSFMLEDTCDSPEAWLESVNVTQFNNNVFLSSVSEMDVNGTQHLSNKKIIWIPNPCEINGCHNSRVKQNNLLVIGLGGRTNYQKNLKNQLDAIALVARKKPIKTILFLGKEASPGMREGFRRYAQNLFKDIGSELQVLEFVTPAQLGEYAKHHIDLFMQISFDESFGYLNWEMMSKGIPTITAPNIETLGTITANPTNIVEMANAILMASDELDSYKEKSFKIACEVARNNNKAFANAFKSMLSF